MVIRPLLSHGHVCQEEDSRATSLDRAEVLMKIGWLRSRTESLSTTLVGIGNLIEGIYELKDGQQKVIT